MRRNVLAFLIACISITGFTQNSWVVRETAGDGIDFTSIATAIADAGVLDGDTLDILGTFTESNIVLSKGLVFKGHGEGQTIVQAGANLASSAGRVFFHHTGHGGANDTKFTFLDLTIRYGNSNGAPSGWADWAGAMAFTGDVDLVLDNVTISDNSSNANGIIWFEGRSLEVINTEIVNNVVLYGRGGLYLSFNKGYDQKMVVSNSLFAENTTADHGAIMNLNRWNDAANAGVDSVIIENTTFYKNTGKSGFWTESGGNVPGDFNLVMNNCSFVDNENTETSGDWARVGILSRGGDISNYNLTIQNTFFKGNKNINKDPIQDDLDYYDLWIDDGFKTITFERNVSYYVSMPQHASPPANYLYTENDTLKDESLLAVEALADNGGNVRTIALGTGNAAIDKITDHQLVPVDDARGYIRLGTAYDCGAYETDGKPESEISTDATLSDLTVDGTTVPAFDAATLTYDIELSAGTTTVPTVVGTPTEANANAETIDASSLPGASTVLVTAEDGGTTTTYTVNFTVAEPADTDATLSDLTVDGTTVPAFDAATLTYDIELAEGTTTVPTVVGTPTDVNANAVTTDASSLPGASTVLVTAEDGTTTITYTVNFSIAVNKERWVVRETAGDGVDFTGIATAIAYANVEDGDTLDILGTFTEANIVLSKGLVFLGHGEDQTIIQAGADLASSAGRVFFHHTGHGGANDTKFTFLDLTVQYGNSNGAPSGWADWAGAMAFTGDVDLVLDNVTVRDNSSNANGIIWFEGRSLEVLNTEIVNNVVSGRGGLYFSFNKGYDQKMVVSNSLIAENTTGDHGSMINLYRWNDAANTGVDSVIIENTTFYKNTGFSGFWTESGGNVPDDFNLVINNCSFVDNENTEKSGDWARVGVISRGGDVSNYNLTIQNTFFKGNKNINKDPIQDDLDYYDLWIDDDAFKTITFERNVSYYVYMPQHAFPPATYLYSENDTLKDETVLAVEALADNGGKVRTMALGAGNAAIDKIADYQLVPVDDARGFMRLGAAFDCGAYETDGKSAAEALADASLADLTVDDVTVTGFDAATLTYDIELAAGTTTVPTVDAITNHPAAGYIVNDAAGLPGATTVDVTAVDGSTQTYTINLSVETAIHDRKSDSYYLYPNPVRNVLSLTAEVADIAIYSISGKKIIEVQDVQSQVDVSELSVGVYLVHMKLKNNDLVIRKMVKR